MIAALISPRYGDGKAMSDILKYASGPKFSEDKVSPKINNNKANATALRKLINQISSTQQRSHNANYKLVNVLIYMNAINST